MINPLSYPVCDCVCDYCPFALYFQVIIHATGYLVMDTSRATMSGSHLVV